MPLERFANAKIDDDNKLDKQKPQELFFNSKYI